MLPKLNRRRARFLLTKIDEILAWEQRKEAEKDTRSMPREQFRREVEKELTGRETEPHEIIYFRLYKSQIPVIEHSAANQEKTRSKT